MVTLATVDTMAPTTARGNIHIASRTPLPPETNNRCRPCGRPGFPSCLGYPHVTRQEWRHHPQALFGWSWQWVNTLTLNLTWLSHKIQRCLHHTHRHCVPRLHRRALTSCGRDPSHSWPIIPWSQWCLSQEEIYWWWDTRVKNWHHHKTNGASDFQLLHRPSYQMHSEGKRICSHHTTVPAY